MAKGIKPENSRLNPIYVLQILKEYTDEEHPLSVAQIAEQTNKRFGHLSSTGTVVSASTVKRILEDLTTQVFPEGADPESMEADFGYAIYCVMKKENQYVRYQLLEEEMKQPPTRYYYYESELKKSELITLKDAIETYQYFSSQDVTDIVRKLIRFRPQAFDTKRYTDIAKDGQREEDSRLLYNIEYFHDLIRRKKRAEIIYCAYTFDKKHKTLELHPRPGYPKVVEPFFMMWANGFYYLLTYNEKYETVVSLRLDRIMEIREVDEPVSHYVDHFDPVEYFFEHPIMYGGEKERVELLVRETKGNYIMNILMDTFGRSMRVSEAEDALLLQQLGRTAADFAKEGSTWYKVTVRSVVSGLMLFVMEYCSDCIVLTPQELARKVQENLRLGLGYYCNSQSEPVSGCIVT